MTFLAQGGQYGCFQFREEDRQDGYSSGRRALSEDSKTFLAHDLRMQVEGFYLREDGKKDGSFMGEVNRQDGTSSVRRTGWTAKLREKGRQDGSSAGRRTGIGRYCSGRRASIGWIQTRQQDGRHEKLRKAKLLKRQTLDENNS